MKVKWQKKYILYLSKVTKYKKKISALYFDIYEDFNLRLTDRHVFIDQKVSWKEVVQEAWRLVRAYDENEVMVSWINNIWGFNTGQ